MGSYAANRKTTAMKIKHRMIVFFKVFWNIFSDPHLVIAEINLVINRLHSRRSFCNNPAVSVLQNHESFVLDVLYIFGDLLFSNI